MQLSAGRTVELKGLSSVKFTQKSGIVCSFPRRTLRGERRRRRRRRRRGKKVYSKQQAMRWTLGDEEEELQRNLYSMIL